MKTTIIIMAALLATLVTFLAAGSLVTNNELEVRTSAQLGAKVIASLQESSFAQYEQLFPSLAEFNELMEKNAETYGGNLKAAQADFAKEYRAKLIPQVKQAFAKLQTEGKEKGIDWSSVKYLTTSIEQAKSSNNTPIHVVVDSNGKRYEIVIQNVLVIKGQWRIGQFVKLI